MDKEFSGLVQYLDQKFGVIDAKFINLQEEIRDLRQDVNGLRESIQALTVSVDKLVGAVSDLKIEYAAMTNQVNRHEKWLHLVAEKLGIKLEY
ncbi:MAG: hypothetical protein HY577_00005 [Candidatus Nealsonbacteria bacterium]|nr:hypothetical protein [Candidatus Nealsonbacteria bacterium]